MCCIQNWSLILLFLTNTAFAIDCSWLCLIIRIKLCTKSAFINLLKIFSQTHRVHAKFIYANLQNAIHYFAIFECVKYIALYTIRFKLMNSKVYKNIKIIFSVRNVSCFRKWNVLKGFNNVKFSKIFLCLFLPYKYI